MKNITSNQILFAVFFKNKESTWKTWKTKEGNWGERQKYSFPFEKKKKIKNILQELRLGFNPNQSINPNKT